MDIGIADHGLPGDVPLQIIQREAVGAIATHIRKSALVSTSFLAAAGATLRSQPQRRFVRLVFDVLKNTLVPCFGHDAFEGTFFFCRKRRAIKHSGKAKQGHKNGKVWCALKKTPEPFAGQSKLPRTK